MAEEQKNEVLYSCAAAPSIKVKLGGERYQAANGVLRLPPRAAKELDEMKAKGRHDLAVLQKIDTTKAEQIAKEHMERRRQQAIAGAMNSTNAVNTQAQAEKLAADTAQVNVAGTHQVASAEGVAQAATDAPKATRPSFATRTQP
jgi:hypothetical protein